MRTFLSQGAHSNVYVDDEQPEIVIKENKHHQSGQTYLSRQLRGYDIAKAIRTKNTNTGVTLPSLIEMRDTGTAQIIKEKLIPGKPFTYEMYDALSETQRNKIAKQMAKFLDVMHSSFKCDQPKESIKNIFNGKMNNADDIIARFGGKLPSDIAFKLKQAEQYISATDISDEFIVMTHGDLRTSNIIYDDKTEKIGVVDFELADRYNVYHDFIAKAPASSMPWDFTKRVIDYYNQIPDKKYPITINPEKVQNMLVYGIMHEFARCLKETDNADKKYFALLRKKLELVTGIEFNSEQSYKNAIGKVQKQETQKTAIKINKKQNYEI